uniref:ArdIorf2 n=1 Tax=Kibdelosporangium aridum TaxID=2030 RepID=Q48376_KIBAR|nr:ardIorf2 [Kibdelosporangium aridum]
MTSQAVVTGLGVVSPNGFGVTDYWNATCGGKSGIGRITRFDARRYPAKLAGEVAGFNASDHLPSRLIPQTDRMTQLALVSADDALADADVRTDEATPESQFGMGVVTSSSCGGFEFGQRELQNLWSKGGQYVSAYQSFAWFYAVNTGQISIRHGMRGPSGVLVSDQAGGLDALGHACRLVRNGTDLSCPVASTRRSARGVGSPHLASGSLSVSEEPERAYLPFDTDAAGHVPGEGGALLIIENADAARRRGVTRVYGEICGYGATFDPRPASGREPTLRKAIEIALDNAGMLPEDIDVVFADAAAIPELDEVEAKAISEVFGPRGVPVTAPKTMTGRLASGAAALDVATALLAIRAGVIPPTTNVALSPDYDIDLVVQGPRHTPLNAAVVLARGHGGFNSAVVVRSVDWN